MRRFATPVGLLLAALLMVGCGDGESDSADTRPAITVNSTTISVDELVDQLRTIAANPRLARYLRQEDEKLVPKPDTINPDLAQSYINLVVQQVFIDREFARRKLKIAEEDRAAATEKVGEIFYGSKIFEEFPEEFRDLIVDRQLRTEALAAALPKAPAATEADLRDLYTQVQKQCPSAKTVSQIWTKTKRDADAIAAELTQGADFATLARERSADEASAERGGVLTCVGAAQYKGYPEDFRGAAESLGFGEISVPFPSADGYAMLTVVPMTYENMLPLLELEFVRKQVSPLAAFLLEEMKTAETLKVQPRFAKVVRHETFSAITPRFAPVDLSD